MARQNIDEAYWSDPRRGLLIAKLGCHLKADGAVLNAWKLAERYWVPNQKAIPITAWKIAGLPMALIEVGFAELKDNGDFVYVNGSKDFFAWRFKKRSSGAKGGRKNKGKKLKQTEANNTKDEQTEASSSYSFSSSSSVTSTDSELYSVGQASADAAAAEIKSPVGYFIGTYVRAYQAKHGEKARPDLRGKVQGQIKSLLKEVPLQRACDLIQTYCQMSDSWFLTKAHDFPTFMENLGKVGLALDTGKVMTQTQIRQADKAAHAQDQLRRIHEGTL
jgi:hypothetical protein